jgi:hypothetical protein
MASWKSLDTELPLALKEQVAFVAKRVWRDVGNKVVLQLDHWHHLARVSYIPPPPRGTAPQALIVNCVEGEADRPAQNTVYTVDVFSRRVKIKDGTDRDYAPVPADCADALNALEAWVREMPAREEAARQEAAARRQAVLQAQEEASRKRKRETDEAMEDYTDRLRHSLALTPPDDLMYFAEEGIDIEELITDPHVRGRCPFFKNKLGTCRKCKVLSCLFEECLGQGYDRLAQCVKHANEVYCAECRGDTDDSDGEPGETRWDERPLVACLVCKSFRCPAAMIICDGVDESGEKLVTKHAPRIICCPPCSRRKDVGPDDDDPDDSGPRDIGRTCSSPDCPKRAHSSTFPGGRTHYSECVAATGAACPRHEDSWFCGFCADKRNACPSCGLKACAEDEHARCAHCGKMDSCLACRDGANGAAATIELVTFGDARCDGCKSSYSVCGACAPKDKSCAKCDDDICPGCRIEEKRPACKVAVHVCERCSNDLDDCSGCGMPTFYMEREYDGDYYDYEEDPMGGGGFW